MPVTIENTPNPNALKFTVGRPVGGPITLSSGDSDHPLAAPLFEIEGVASVFMTADFVTLTKAPDGDWNAIAPIAETILADHYG